MAWYAWLSTLAKIKPAMTPKISGSENSCKTLVNLRIKVPPTSSVVCLPKRVGLSCTQATTATTSEGIVILCCKAGLSYKHNLSTTTHILRVFISGISCVVATTTLQQRATSSTKERIQKTSDRNSRHRFCQEEHLSQVVRG